MTVNKDKKDTKKADSGNGAKADAPAMPSGMKLVTPAEGDPSWFKPYEGAIIHGRLIGRFPRSVGKGHFYQIKVMEPVRAIRGRGDDSEVVELLKGEVVNVDERSALSGLVELTDGDGIYNVWIHCLEKVPIQGGKTFWRMEVAQECLRTPTRQVEVERNLDDIPF